MSLLTLVVLVVCNGMIVWWVQKDAYSDGYHAGWLDGHYGHPNRMEKKTDDEMSD